MENEVEITKQKVHLFLTTRTKLHLYIDGLAKEREVVSVNRFNQQIPKCKDSYHAHE